MRYSNRRQASVFVFLIVGMLALQLFSTPFNDLTHAATLHVDDDSCPGLGDGSEMNPFCSIQDAINAAVSLVDDVLVHDGTYIENIDFSGKAIMVHSENGPEVTTIDGGANGSVVTFTSGEIVTSVLEGFTITNGAGAAGGGVYCGSGTSPEITGCIITGNSLTGLSVMGGGIYCDSSSPTITHCTIENNSAVDTAQSGKGGGICGTPVCTPQINNCTIRNNRADHGGGIFFSTSYPTFYNSTISGNQSMNGGGGMEFQGCAGYNSPKIYNCTITGNIGIAAGGIFLNTSSLRLSHSTISGNHADGIYCGGVIPYIYVTNSIVWGNAGGAFSYCSYPLVDISYSNIQGGGWDATNIDVDPLFIDPRSAADAPTADGDYHLRTDSPCKDAGTNSHTGLIIPDRDIDGHARPLFAGNDMGSDEIDTAIVAPSGGNFTTIQAAIDAANDGCTIIVKDGTYQERINFNGKAIILRSENGPDKAIIDGSVTLGTIVTFNNGESADSVLEGFTITNGWSEKGGGIACYGASPTIRNCFLTINAASGVSNRLGGGLYCSNASPTVTNCTFAKNSAGAGLLSGNGGAIYCDNASPEITNCTIVDNWTLGIFPANGGGICCVSGSSPTVVNTIVWGNSAAADGNQIFTDGTSSISVAYSDIQNGWPGTENIDSDPLFTHDGYYHLMEGSPCKDSGTDDQMTYPLLPVDDIDGDSRPLDTGHDMGADEYWMIIVPDSFATIQEAIDAASNGNRILARSGTYNENIRFDGKAITLISENGASETTINGGGSGNVVTFNTDEGPGSVLDGFTITNGSADTGGGIRCYYASPAIKNCRISGNSAEDGGGMSCYYSSPILVNIAINSNSAIYYGGGIACTGGSPVLTNCTIADNDAVIQGGGIYSKSGGTPAAVNSIIWGNRAAGIDNDFHLEGTGDSISLAYSNYDPTHKTGIGNLSEIEDNIHADPLFAGSNDFHLASDSPCIDKGSDNTGTYPYIPVNDLDGDTRPKGSGHDIGSDEVTCPDADGDDYFGESGCGSDLDCADDDASINPGASEVCDHEDNDCDALIDEEDPDLIDFTIFYGDTDGDGFGDQNNSIEACEAPPGYVENNGDWDDNDNTVYPGAPELDDGKDNDQDGHIDEINVGSETHTGEDDFGTIQEAIDYVYDNQGSANDTIIVRSGVYPENVDFRGLAITVQSADGPEVTTIDGNQSGSVVTFQTGETQSTILDGFTITNGSGTEYYSKGGGIYCINNSAPTITNCIIQKNSADWYGGGVYTNSSPGLTLTDCTIKENSVLQYDGGGVYCSGNTSWLIISRCIVIGNQAPGNGGGIYDSGQDLTIPSSFSNCIITGNAANTAGGLFSNGRYGIPKLITHCTVSGNSASNVGGVHVAGGEVQVVNSIIRGNLGGSNTSQITGPSSIVNYSNIEGGWPYGGVDNIDADPLFADPKPGSDAPITQGNYHLLTGSPCIDAGTSDTTGYPNIPADDIHGDSRPEGLSHDMGADEYTEYNAAPSAPSVLTGDPVSAVTLDLAWSDNADNEQGFQLERKTGSGGTYRVVAVLAPDTVVYQDTGLNPATEYYYRTAAYNNNGSSAYSNEVSAVTPANTVVSVCFPTGSYHTIQEAINNAQDGDEIVVCSGTYQEQIDFSGKAITVRSSLGSDHTTIDGTGSGTVVTFANGEKKTSVLRGFTITGGQGSNGSQAGGIYCNAFKYSAPKIVDCIITANGSSSSYNRGVYAEFSSLHLEDCTISNHQCTSKGSGLHFKYGAPVMDDCIVDNNMSTDNGGGLYAENTSLVLNNNIISSNSAYRGGGIYCHFSDTIISNCDIENNSVTNVGGGIYFSSASLFLENSKIFENTATNTNGQGGGIYTSGDADVQIESCTVSGNTAESIAGGIYGQDPLVSNCSITGNSAGNGGGIYITNYGASIFNSTISGNYASNSGGGIYDGYAAIVVNSIIWGNHAMNTGPQLSGSTTASFSNIDMGNPADPPFTGVGNINEDPVFIDPRLYTDAPTAAGNYHLQSTSPCIDSGNNTDVPVDVIEDIDGDSRILDGDCNGSVIVDMGADEVTCIPPCEADVDNDGDVDGNDLQIIAAWYAVADPQADIDAGGSVDQNDLTVFAADFGRTSCP